VARAPLRVAGARGGCPIGSLGPGASAGPAFAGVLSKPFHAVGLGGAAHPVAVVLALGVVVFAHTVIGEMVPKNLTLAGPERAVLWLGPPMLAFCVATKPLLIAMKWAAHTILSLWRIETTDAVKTVFTAQELAGLAAQATTEGLLAPEEHARITGALARSQRVANDALRRWSEVTTVAEDVSPASLEVLATRTNRSRFPVVERSSRRVLGFVHVKDVLGFVGPQRRAPIPPELVRPLAIV